MAISGRLFSWGFSLCLAASAFLPAFGDTVKVWVSLRDKGPAAPPSAKRAYEDRPVHDPYVQALSRLGLACDTRLKWQNRVSGRIEAGKLGALRSLPFVSDVRTLPRKQKAFRPGPGPALPWRAGGLAKSAAGSIDYGAGRALAESLHIDRVHAWMARQGLPPGRGVRIAVIDADFHLGSPFFDHLKSQGRIKDQWDFVADSPAAVTAYQLGSHGAQSLSLIGSNLPGTLVGAAPEADYLLYRAEDVAQERYVEEDFVAAAIERAVDSGAQVINISLGYRYEFSDGSPDLPYAQFDGRTRPSSLAALGAARRNVLVSVAVGNLPDSLPSTPSLSAPADADSILAVGIVDRARIRCGYSCTGPSADGRVKPDLVSMGVVGTGGCLTNVANTAAAEGALNSSGGTSFAAPVIAGIAALMRQIRPELSAEEIRQALIRTADRADNPDSGRGHGLADPVAALRSLGIVIPPRLQETGIARFYHPGGRDPIAFAWDKHEPRPSLQLIDITGRRIRATVRVTGDLLLLQPDRALQTGVYIARIP